MGLCGINVSQFVLCLMGFFANAQNDRKSIKKV